VDPERVTRWQESGGKWKPGPVTVWTPQQTGEFLDAIEGDRFYPLYSLAAFAGLRRAEVAGLPPVRFHDLRHGSAALSLAAGVDIKVVQEMLGHATSAFTRDVYTSAVPEIAAAAAEAVAAIVPRRANSVPTGG
jgi:integrase